MISDFHLYTADQQAAAERGEASVALCGFERPAGSAEAAALHVPVELVPCEECQARAPGVVAAASEPPPTAGTLN